MSPVTIESTPVGAEVVIDGEYVGITPVSVQTIGDDLMEFRSVCMSGDQVSCGWDVIRPWLEDRSISGFWNDLAVAERKSIAIKAIENKLSFSIGSYREGNPNCEGGFGEWRRAVCDSNALIRVVTFGHPLGVDGVRSWYWKRNTEYTHVPGGDVEHCYYQPTWYGLPTYYATDFVQNEWYHSIAAIHIGDSMSSIDDFVIFQFSLCDIKPSEHGQVRFGSNIMFFDVPHIPYSVRAADVVASFFV